MGKVASASPLNTRFYRALRFQSTKYRTTFKFTIFNFFLSIFNLIFVGNLCRWILVKLIINHRYHDHLSSIDNSIPSKSRFSTGNSSDGLMKLPGSAEDFDRLGQVISMAYMLRPHDYFDFEMMKSCFSIRFEGKCHLR